MLQAPASWLTDGRQQRMYCKAADCVCPTSSTVQNCFQKHAAQSRSPHPRPRAPHGATRRFVSINVSIRSIQPAYYFTTRPFIGCSPVDSAHHHSKVCLEHVSSAEAIKPCSWDEIRANADSFHCFTSLHRVLFLCVFHSSPPRLCSDASAAFHVLTTSPIADSNSKTSPWISRHSSLRCGQNLFKYALGE